MSPYRTTLLNVTVIDRNGLPGTYRAAAGTPLMHLLRELGAVDAVCGGGISCGTCSVGVDPLWQERLPQPDECEQALLEGMGCEPGPMRLSCQLQLQAELDGLVVKIVA